MRAVYTEVPVPSVRPCARQLTGRGKILEVDSRMGAAELCRQIAESRERFAALYVRVEGRDPLARRLYKRVRDLCSAEGALMIWDDTAAASPEEAQSWREYYAVQADLHCSRET